MTKFEGATMGGPTQTRTLNLAFLSLLFKLDP